MKNFLLLIAFSILTLTQCFSQDNISLWENDQSAEWNVISVVKGGLEKIYFVDSTNGYVIGDSGKIYSTQDGGTTWQPQNSSTDSRLLSINFINDSTGYIAGYNKTLIHTNNKGIIWEPVQIVSDTGTIYDGLTCDSANNIYFITNFGEVYSSGDSGRSWLNTYNFSKWGFSDLDFSNYPVCFAFPYGMGVFFKSTDGGSSWNKLSTPVQFSGSFRFLNSNIGWVTESWILSSAIHDSASAYVTTDGGETWSKQLTVEGIEIINLTFAGNNEVWASSYNPFQSAWLQKIFYTSDGGQSWIQQFEARTDTFGVITDIFFLDNTNGWALTNTGKIIKYKAHIQVFVEEPIVDYPDEYIINQNYPNPFNPSTTILYTIPEPGFVTIKIFDVLGNEVQTLVNEFQARGNYSINFNAENLSSGIYFYKIQAGSKFTETRKMLLLK